MQTNMDKGQIGGFTIHLKFVKLTSLSQQRGRPRQAWRALALGESELKSARGLAMQRRAIYIKPMTWNGQLRYYIGMKPSNPNARPCYRLGGYFIVCQSFESARRIANSEAHRLGIDVIECDHYIGY
jgi:hypothetical protein